MSVAQRRARLGVRHHLAVANRGAAPARLANDLVALHATDPASVYLSLAARSGDLRSAHIAAALYDDRTMVRMLGMRRTMFVVPTETAALVQHSSTNAVAARLRRALVKDLAASVDNPERWLTDLEDDLVRRLRDGGPVSALTLSKAEPRLRTTIEVAAGKSYGGPVTIGGRVLNILGAHGRVVRARPGGSWTGSQYLWAPTETWLPVGIPVLPADEARIGLLRAWLARFGPATLADATWWTGWNLGDTGRAVQALATVDVDLDGQDGIVLADDTEPVDDPPPWVALLPALDPTPMGWTRRDWYLDPVHRPALFDRTGNIGPTVWCDGRIVGGWGQGADASVRVRLLEDIGADQTEAVHAEAARLTAWMDGVRVTPKFRTPLERELASE